MVLGLNTLLTGRVKRIGDTRNRLTTRLNGFERNKRTSWSLIVHWETCSDVGERSSPHNIEIRRLAVSAGARGESPAVPAVLRGGRTGLLHARKAAGIVRGRRGLSTVLAAMTGPSRRSCPRVSRFLEQRKREINDVD